MKLVFEKLGQQHGCPELGLPALGSLLFSRGAVSALDGCEIANRDLLGAIRSLCFITYNHTRRPVDFKNLGSEELGSVYESLLELHPDLNVDAASFELKTAGGHERKTTGSYYTPTSLVRCLLDSALDPVLDEATRSKNPENALLDLKICDPACGSGHFLVAAAHRVARRLASVRTGDEEPSPEATRTALRDVIGRCLYGVDLNPMAVELCKVSLWMEALEPGKPLSFLDHHIQCGNSLLGTTPKLMADGIPDEAFNPIEGDDKKVASALKRRNRQQRQGQTMYTVLAKAHEEHAFLVQTLIELSSLSEDRIEHIVQKEEIFRNLVSSVELEMQRLLANAWCAAFVWKKSKEAPLPVTYDVFRRLAIDPKSVPQETLAGIENLADQYKFFHWHVAFPQVFQLPPKGSRSENEDAGWNGGFDVVLGNPPWEAGELVEKEFFASRVPKISEVRTKAKRKELIDDLKYSNPSIFQSWQDEKRKYSARSQFCKSSNLFPRGVRGKLNTYRLFAELASFLGNHKGRIAQVLKTGIVTAQDSQTLFQHWIISKRVVSVHDFINTKPIFPSVVSNERFCLLTLSGQESPIETAQYTFGLNEIEQIRDSSRMMNMRPEDIKLINPNDISVPPASGPKDYLLLLRVHKKFRVLRTDDGDWNPWNLHYTQGHLNSSSGSALFKDNTLEELELKGGTVNQDQSISLKDQIYLPLYEGKFIGQMNHRFGTFDGVNVQNRFGTKAEAHDPSPRELANPEYEIQPRYWLGRDDAYKLYESKGTRHAWLFSFRDVCRAIVDARTLQACILPRLPCLDGCPLLVFDSDSPISASRALILNSLWASYIYDYIARQKIHGAHLTKAIAYQLPTPSPEQFKLKFLDRTWESFISPRSLELTTVTYSILPFAHDCGYDGPPFRWDEERRFLIRCELDAAYFHLYGIERDDVDYIMETFPIVKRKDEQRYDEYRTKRVILEIYDAMADAIRSGKPYQTILDPPPADPKVAHLPKGGVRPKGEVYELTDLLNVDLPGEVVPVRLPKEFRVEACNADGIARFRFVNTDSNALNEKTTVIVRHPELTRAETKLPIAAGEVLSIQKLFDPLNEQAVFQLILKTPGGLIKLKLPEEAWRSFRPLCVLETK